MEDKKETHYTIFADCTNCKARGYKIEIKKGTTISEHLQAEVCPNCGCDRLTHGRQVLKVPTSI